MIDYIICDDNKRVVSDASDVVKRVCKKYGVSANVITYYDFTKEFIKYIRTNRRQAVYIIDIELPTDSGLTISRLIRKYDINSVIIFLSSHNEMAYNIVRDHLNILTFVSKTYDYRNDLAAAVKLSLDYVKPCAYISFNDTKLDYKINTKDILYLTKDDRKTVIVTDKNIYNVYKSISQIEEMLPLCFVRTHRACIVNKERIESYNSTKRIIIFDNGTKIDLISDKYKKDLVLECN